MGANFSIVSTLVCMLGLTKKPMHLDWCWHYDRWKNGMSHWFWQLWSYLQNVLMVRIICVCEGHLEKKKKNMEHHIILSMAKVVSNWWGLYILLWGQVFLHVPFHWGFHITSFALTLVEIPWFTTSVYD